MKLTDHLIFLALLTATVAVVVTTMVSLGVPLPSLSL
jgi:hypothetical protein